MIAVVSSLALTLGGSILTLEGGGFRATSVDAGFFAGMLAALGEKQGQSAPTMESTNLLGKYTAISSNSGSSWFFSELAYSPSFKALVEGMAASPKTAAAAYRAGWTSKWLAATDVTEKKFNLLGDIARAVVKDLFGTGDEDSIYMLQFFLASGFTWDHFVDVLLNSTSAVLPTTTLGASPSGKWADGKVWLVDHSVVTPTQGKEVRMYTAKGLVGYPRVSYAAQTVASRTLTLYTPAAFSMTLGGGLKADAPFRYVASSAASALADLQYSGTGKIPVIDKLKNVKSSSLGPDLAKNGNTQAVGMLPVSRVAAASSAFLGGVCVESGLIAEATALINGNLAPWASDAPNGQSFAAASALVAKLQSKGGVDQQSLDALATSGVHAVIDGVYTDGTGVANAVAAGASEITILLNSIANTSAASLATPNKLVALFDGAPPPSPKHADAFLTQVFSYPLAPAVVTQLHGFSKLAVVPGSQYLAEVAVGSIAATTAANAHYGVIGGLKVQLNVVSIGSSLNIGAFENLAHYDQLAQEIAQTLASRANVDFVRSKLLPMMLGSSETVEA